MGQKHDRFILQCGLKIYWGGKKNAFNIYLEHGKKETKIKFQRLWRLMWEIFSTSVTEVFWYPKMQGKGNFSWEVSDPSSLLPVPVVWPTPPVLPLPGLLQKWAGSAELWLLCYWLSSVVGQVPCSTWKANKACYFLFCWISIYLRKHCSTYRCSW